jgi:DNA-binding transcriptional MerR regulator
MILRLHADDALLQFIQLVLSEATGVPISKILRALYVPSISDLKEVIESTKDLRMIYEELLQQVQKTLDNAMRLQVLQVRK